ncbi:MAG TPA: hypothetical protein PKH07_07655, partial [bacterium]|nr:hypothetical protein [bacterium]
MKIKTRKKQHGRLSKTLILLLLLVTAFFVLPNVLIAPRLREKLEKKMNRAGSLQGSMGSLTINLFTQRISFGNVSVNYLEKAYSASAKVPSIKVRSRTLPLLRGEIVPRSIVITKPVIVVEEPGVPLPRG